MSNLSMVEAKLPPGFRFHPRDEELICEYLMKKVSYCDTSPLMIEVDLNKCEPWDISAMACVGGKEWYFYSLRDRKYATGLRTNRATGSGYWKATGKDRSVLRQGTLVGMRKTLVFYQGRAPNGRKTDWVMHEFRLDGPLGPPTVPSAKEDWVLCRVFHKNREVAAKQGMCTGSSSCFDDTSSSSLPPLMDSYVTFDQAQANNTSHDQYEQVPCFSIFNPSQTSPTFPHITHMGPTNVLPAKGSSPAALGAIPLDLITTSCFNHPFSNYDDKVVNAVLSHFNMTDSNVNHNVKGSPSLVEGSSESLLSDVGLPAMWNHY